MQHPFMRSMLGLVVGLASLVISSPQVAGQPVGNGLRAVPGGPAERHGDRSLQPDQRGGEETPGQSYAFLVACGDYDRRELRPLKYTRNDVLAFYQVLLDSGFVQDNIVFMHDKQPPRFRPEARKVRKELRRLLGRLRKQDTLIVALAGHGIQFMEEEQGQYEEQPCYFCPVDASLTEPRSLIALPKTYQQLDACRAVRKLLVIDTGYGNPQSKASRRRGEVRLNSLPRLEQVPLPRKTVALFRSPPAFPKGDRTPKDKSPVPFSEQGQGKPAPRRRPFFSHIVKAWQTAADGSATGVITLSELTAYLSEKASKDVAFRGAEATPRSGKRRRLPARWVLSGANPALIKAKEGDEALWTKGYDRALSRYTEALRLRPGLARAIEGRALTYQAMGNADKALAEFTELLRLKPKNVAAYLNRGFLYEKQKKYDEAIQDFTALIRLDPAMAPAYLARAVLYEQKKEYKSAIQDFSEVIRLLPKDASAYAQRGSACEAIRDYDRAIADFTEAIRLDPQNAAARASRGSIYLEKTNYDAALADFTEVIRLSPKEASAYFNRGTIHQARQKYDLALADFTAALQLNPKDPAALLARASLHQSKKDYEQAIADYTKAIEVDPDNVYAYSSRGAAYSAHKDIDQAIADYTKVLEIDPRNAGACHARGQAFKAKALYYEGEATKFRMKERLARKMAVKKKMAKQAKKSVKRAKKARRLAEEDLHKAGDLDPGLAPK